MGPNYGTEEYKEQVNTIVTAIGGVKDLSLDDLNQLLMMYILDTSYSRVAICEAEKILKKKIGVII